MNTKIKIIIGILIVGFVAIGRLWIWEEQAYPEAQEVAITTDKTEYNQGESVELTVKNKSPQTIIMTDSPYSCFSGIEILEGNEWVNIWQLGKYKRDCNWAFKSTCEGNTRLLVIKTNESSIFYWDQKLWDCDPRTNHPSFSEIGDSTFVFTPNGRYRIAVTIYTDFPDKYEVIYSNEFIIK